jgi:hypothetical protein
MSCFSWTFPRGRKIQIGKFHRDAPSFDLRQLAKVTDSFTGSEIKQVFIEALYRAFEQDQEPTDLTIGEVLVDFVPLSKLMGESMTALRPWAKGRARAATTPPSERSTPEDRGVSLTYPRSSAELRCASGQFSGGASVRRNLRIVAFFRQAVKDQAEAGHNLAGSKGWLDLQTA